MRPWPRKFDFGVWLVLLSLSLGLFSNRCLGVRLAHTGVEVSMGMQEKVHLK